MGNFKSTMSLDELRQRNEQTRAAAQKPPEQPKPAPQKG